MDGGEPYVSKYERVQAIRDLLPQEIQHQIQQEWELFRKINKKQLLKGKDRYDRIKCCDYKDIKKMMD